MLLYVVVGVLLSGASGQSWCKDKHSKCKDMRNHCNLDVSFNFYLWILLFRTTQVW